MRTKGLIGFTPKDVYGNDVSSVMTSEITMPDGTTAIGYKFEHLQAGEYDVVFNGKNNGTIKWSELQSTIYQAKGVDFNRNSDTKDSKTLLTQKLDTATAAVSIPQIETTTDVRTFENGNVDNGLVAPLTVVKTTDKPNGTIIQPGQSLMYTVAVTTAIDRSDFVVSDNLPRNMTIASDIVIRHEDETPTTISKNLAFDGTGALTIAEPFRAGTTTIVYTMIANDFNGSGLRVVNNTAEVLHATENTLKHVSITKAADKATAKVGDTITYTLNVTNTGNVDLHDVAVKEKNRCCSIHRKWRNSKRNNRWKCVLCRQLLGN